MEVCRGCGRIASLALSPEEMVLLDRFSARSPAGWSVDGISLTLTGTCRKCREGPPE
jgi:Fe2+ or Zn2+ uptake regulation protein